MVFQTSHMVGLVGVFAWYGYGVPICIGLGVYQGVCNGVALGGFLYEGMYHVCVRLLGWSSGAGVGLQYMAA
jgi:hypothetical protein